MFANPRLNNLDALSLTLLARFLTLVTYLLRQLQVHFTNRFAITKTNSHRQYTELFQWLACAFMIGTLFLLKLLLQWNAYTQFCYTRQIKESLYCYAWSISFLPVFYKIKIELK